MQPNSPTGSSGASANLLLIGAGGMLGRAWRQMLAARGATFDAPKRGEMDLTSEASIEAGVREGHRLVINCAAYTDVDGAETHEAEAMRLNGEAVGVLARRCAAVGATLVHYSTDYVFNGHGTRPYRIDDPIEPLNAYGRTKAAGERLLLDSGADHLLIRISWLYAPWGKNFVRTIARFAAERDVLRVVNDQRGRPTSCEPLAAATMKLIDAGARGVYHVTDGGECTWHDFAAEIARLRGAACRVDPCTTAEFPRPAKRPAYSVLNLSASEKILGPMSDWRTNLADVIGRLE
ncbi:MAG: dTDP-4-dehydrorhamnose reductase [Planctomycetes bacterium]|nr:dTDP-4-dehydrorhamnose reductase [Planctomycetota bacterium]